jgi:diphosphomevalonate decarboxylase
MQARAIAHPNIALVKYWGKRDAVRNLPAVGSVSITLDGMSTTTEVRFDPGFDADSFSLDGSSPPAMLRRVRHCLDLFRERLDGVPHAAVTSRNDFPTGAGLASSASGFAALVVAVDRALASDLDESALGEIARRCSGSAPRSLHGGFVELGFVSGSDRTETFVRQLVEPEGWPLEVVIAITSDEEKAIGSTEGMTHTAATSPYYREWVAASDDSIDHARRAIFDRDFDALAEVAEASCLGMHAVMMAARPGLLYWNGTTVECIHRLRELRRSGVGVFFTIDAGPQVKAVCVPEAVGAVRSALAEITGVSRLLVCGLGAGARAVEA